MPFSRQSRWMAGCRRAVRWCGLALLLLVLLAGGAGLYLNRVGLPHFLKTPLITALQERGMTAGFSRMHWHWTRGIVISDLVLSRSFGGPQVSAAHADLDIRLGALLRGRIHIDSLLVSGGELVWPVSSESSGDQRQLALRQIDAAMRFPSLDEIHLQHFTARFLDANLSISGALTNASSIQEWSFMRPDDAAADEIQGQLRRLERALSQFNFPEPPDLFLTAHGDAGQFRHLEVELNLIVPAAKTPWATVENLYFAVRLPKLSAAGLEALSDVTLSAGPVESRWGSAGRLSALVTFSQSEAEENPILSEGFILLEELETPWASAGQIEFSAHSTHVLPHAVPQSGLGTFHFTGLQTRWGGSDRGRIEIQFNPSQHELIRDESWGCWNWIEPYRLAWQAELDDVKSPELEVHRLNGSGRWEAPELVVDELQARLYDGELAAVAEIDVSTRQLRARFTSDFDPHHLAGLLSEDGQHWLAQFSWQAPQFEGEIDMALPPWTDRAWDWHDDLLPGATMTGRLASGKCAFRGVPAESARSDFTYSNRTWHLPNLRLIRPEGEIELDYTASNVTREYRIRLLSRIDVKAVESLLDEEQRFIFDFVEFSQPPLVRAEVAGRWSDYDSISVSAEVAASAFLFRGTWVDAFTASVEYANAVLELANAKITRGDEQLSAARATLDFSRDRVTLADVHSTMDPMVVTRAIGPIVAEAIEPYRFQDPPTVRLEGFFSTKRIEETDLRFVVEGTRLEWFRFAADEIAGSVHWLGETLTLTNVQAKAYGNGRIAGWAFFDFTPEDNVQFRFKTVARNVDFGAAAAHFDPSRRSLEGVLNGELTITSANTAGLKGWHGDGWARLHDGLLWEMPLFGIFSPVLEAVAPGYGTSRAGAASTHFAIERSVVYFDDLEIRAPTMRMQYRGSVDFEQRVHARVEAEILRDAWIVGRVVSLALTPLTKLFEYQVTGTLAEPVHQPVYVPRFLMMTLRPFNTLKTLLNEGQPPALREWSDGATE